MQSDEVVGDHPPSRWKQVLLGLVAFLATPVVITAMFRVMTDAVPGWLPPAALALIAVALLFIERIPRAVPMGILAGCIAWTAFLYWLFARWDSMSGG